MKKIILLLFSMFVLFSCSDDKNDTEKAIIVSKWKLVEVLSDPGNGSGTFLPVTSSKIIEFYDDGTLYSNGSICNISIESNSNFNGTYSSQNLTIESSQCQQQAFLTTYEMTQTTLIINYPCIEPCAEKYTKIQ